MERLRLNFSPEVTYKNPDREYKLTKDNTQVIIVPDQFELSCVCHYDIGIDEDPILIFREYKLMEMLAEKGFEVRTFEDEIPKFLIDTYAQLEADNLEYEQQL